jgi:ADP-heptose:LPS heptosyltransferase
MHRKDQYQDDIERAAERLLGVPERVAIFGYPHLGDAAHTTSVARWVKQRWPRTEVTIFASELARPVWELCPYVDHVESRRGSRLKLIAKLRKGRFDLGLLLYPQNTTVLIAALGGVKTRIGIQGRKNNGLLHVAGQELREPPLMLSSIRAVMRGLGFEVDDLSPAMDLTRLPRPKQEPGAVGLVYGASHPAKRWPVERFAEISLRLRAQGIPTLAFGSAAEGEELEAGSLNLGENLAGKTTVLEMMAELANCRFVVTNDTGPMHLAGAVGTPCIALFGPTSAALHPAPGEGHHYLEGKCSCAGKGLDSCTRECLGAISVEEVWEACCEFMRVGAEK